MTFSNGQGMSFSPIQRQIFQKLTDQLVANLAFSNFGNVLPGKHPRPVIRDTSELVGEFCATEKKRSTSLSNLPRPVPFGSRPAAYI